MVQLKAGTIAELRRLSPVEKLEAAEWLRQEAREQLEKLEPGEGSTAAEATAALEALRGLDKASRALVMDQIRREEARADG